MSERDQFPIIDQFSRLLATSFRDVPLPVTRWEMTLAHDLAQHKPWNMDGGNVEDTGIDPIRHSLVLMFSNNIAPAPTEQWKAGDQYPGNFRRFLAAYRLRTKAYLVHPEFGAILVRPEQAQMTWLGERRSGIEVHASFVETLDDVQATYAASDVDALVVTTTDFDTSADDLRKIVPQLPVYQTSLADIARQIQAIGDTASIAQSRAGAQLDTLIYRANAIADSLERAKSVRTWPAQKQIEEIWTAAVSARAKLATQRRRLGIYVTLEDSTIAGLMMHLGGTDIADVMKLNPDLMASPFVPARTFVRYFKEAA